MVFNGCVNGKGNGGDRSRDDVTNRPWFHYKELSICKTAKLLTGNAHDCPILNHR